MWNCVWAKLTDAGRAFASPTACATHGRDARNGPILFGSGRLVLGSGRTASRNPRVSSGVRAKKSGIGNETRSVVVPSGRKNLTAMEAVVAGPHGFPDRLFEWRTVTGTGSPWRCTARLNFLASGVALNVPE